MNQERRLDLRHILGRRLPAVEGDRRRRHQRGTGGETGMWSLGLITGTIELHWHPPTDILTADPKVGLCRSESPRPTPAFGRRTPMCAAAPSMLRLAVIAPHPDLCSDSPH